MNTMINAMRNRMSRLIELSAAGTFGIPKPSRISFRERLMFEILRRTVLRNSFDDHAVADQLVHQSELRWTIVQPPELDDGPARGYQISLDGLLRGGSVSRLDVCSGNYRHHGKWFVYSSKPLRVSSSSLNGIVPKTNRIRDGLS